MKKPVVGVIGNSYRAENRFATQMVGERNLLAISEVAGALPLMFGGSPAVTDVAALLDAVDGIVLTGAAAWLLVLWAGLFTRPWLLLRL